MSKTSKQQVSPEIIYNDQSECIINPAVGFEYDTDNSNNNKMIKNVPNVKDCTVFYKFEWTLLNAVYSQQLDICNNSHC